MAQFSPSESALAGLRLIRDWPGVMLAWSFVYFGGLLLITLTMMATLGPEYIQLAKHGGLTPDNMDRVSSMLYQSGFGFLLVLVMTILLVSVITGGVLRLILRREEHGFAHLRLGRDELRLAALNVAFVGFYVVSLVVGLLVGQATAPSGRLVSLLGAVLLVGVPSTWFGVRLSLITPLTFDKGRISFREAWALSRGRSWPLFGMILLAVVFYVMIFVVFFVASLALVHFAGGERALQDPTAFTPFTALAAIASLIMQFLLQVLQIVMIYGPFAEAYREIRDDMAAGPALAESAGA